MTIPMIAPEQELFDAFFIALEKEGYRVFDYLPPKETKYPFAVVGNTQLVAEANKSYISGNINILLHAWGEQKQRKQVSDMLTCFLMVARELKQTDHYKFQAVFNSASSQMVGDTSVADTFLWHGVFSIDMRLI
ncbi:MULTISPECIES: hypothetical protein [Listeria]|uniref:hypothetical protein n=1 Tax=Listeria TaxID=1637 RepID=UPI000B597D8F|nr:MULTISPECIES: hypothetical protein [Listeria]